jgi:hypothetical protein
MNVLLIINSLRTAGCAFCFQTTADHLIRIMHFDFSYVAYLHFNTE